MRAQPRQDTDREQNGSGRHERQSAFGIKDLVHVAAPKRGGARLCYADKTQTEQRNADRTQTAQRNLDAADQRRQDADK
jgi:hypothetical protein